MQSSGGHRVVRAAFSARAFLFLALLVALGGLPAAVADEDPAHPVCPPETCPAPATAPPAITGAGGGGFAPAILSGNAWQPVGPAPNTNGQVENVGTDDQVCGAVHVVCPHPTNANILYCGGTNGGIWRTDDALSASPTWTPQIDGAAAMTIGALEFDPTDASSNTLLAGIGRFSSFGLAGGLLTGLLRTTNGGATWTPISDPLLVGENISGVAARGGILVAGSNGNLGTGRLMRSTDTGATWSTISGTGGLPAGDVFDLVGDPGTTSRLYCSVEDTGIFRSDDTGLTWTNISSSDATLNGFITTASNNNTEMAVGPTGRLWVAVLLNGQARYIGYTTNPTAASPTWTAMDLPLTMEGNGDTEGLNPREKPGGQGSIHFSIVADPMDPDLVYVAGDRQDLPFPNAIGAVDYSGRLFRGDSGVTPIGNVPGSPQWDHLTHVQDLVFIGGGTASSSSPHADSREMRFDANGDLLESDDGGIYRRTSPTDNTGDWFSLIGNLQVTEFHNIAYDSFANVVMGGAQDTGSSFQTSTGSTIWFSITTADGGDIAIDDTSAPGWSYRYSSYQNLGGFLQTRFDAANNLLGFAYPSLFGYAGAQFTTPVELNARDQTRMLIGSGFGVWESTNQGASGSFIPGIPFLNSGGHDPLVYGGRSGGVDNLDVVYAGAGSEVYVRTAAAPAAAVGTGFPGGSPRDIVLDPDDWMTAYVCTASTVYFTSDAGATWADVTGNLPTLLPGPDLHAIEFITDVPSSADGIAVGTRAGVYYALTANPTSWSALGTGMPNVPVYDLDYDVTDDKLIAGTFGRGAWILPMLTDNTPPTLTSAMLRTLLWPPSRGLLPVGFSASATDDTDPNPTVTVEVWSNEDNGTAPYAPDATGATLSDLKLRAERAYPGTGRVYLVIVRATDGSGNSTTQCKAAVVPLLPVGVSIMQVQGLAATALATCTATGNAPAGYFLVHTHSVP